MSVMFRANLHPSDACRRVPRRRVPPGLPPGGVRCRNGRCTGCIFRLRRRSGSVASLGRPGGNFHGRTVAQELDTAGDEQIAGGESPCDFHVAVRCVHAERHGARLRLGALHDVDGVAIFRGLYGQRRHDDGLPRGAHGHVHLAERSGPEPVLVLLVVDLARHGHEPRRRIRSVRDESDVRRVRVRAFLQVKRRRHPGLQARSVLFRRLKAKQERVALQDRGENGARLKILAVLNGTRLDDPRDGRAHVGITEIQLGNTDRLPRRLDVGFAGRDRRLIRRDLLPGNEARMIHDGALPARELALCLLFARLGFRERRVRLIHGNVESFALDRDERRVLLDELALSERHGVDGSGDARRDLHLLKRLDRAGSSHGVPNLSRRERRDLDGVLELARRLPAALEPGFGRRLAATGGQHPEKKNVSSLHRNSVPSGSSPRACRKFRYACAIEYSAEASLTSSRNRVSLASTSSMAFASPCL